LARFGAGASQNKFTKAGSNNWQMGNEAHLALMETTRMLIYNNEFNNFNLINTMEENQLPFHISYLSI